MSDDPTADFLTQAAAEGVTADELNALGGGSGGGAPGPSSGAGTVTGMDSLGLPSLTGGVANSGLISSLPANATPAQKEAAAMAAYNANPALQQEIQQNYGYIGAYLLAQPELLPILVAAGLEGWDQGALDAAVMSTNWWKNSSQALRNFQEIQSSDPGEAGQQIAQMQDQITNQAQAMGISIPAGDLKNLATMAVGYGWNTDVIQQTLRQSFSGSASTSFGATATFADQAKQLAGEFMQPLSDSELQQYVQQNAQGTLTADGLQQLFSQKAAQQMPWMAASIAQGVTPSQYLSGYASGAATTLSIDPSDVNWTDPKWMSALLQPNAQGQQQPVSIGQFQTKLMKDPSFGYQYTTGARDQAYGTAQTILQTFGAVGK